MFSYNDLNDAKYLICDNDRRVFLMGKTKHENYGLEYHDRELQRFGITQGRVKIGNSVFPKKIQHTIVSKITCTCSTSNEYFMHSLVIRPSVINIYPEMGIRTKIIQILPREVIVNQTNRTLHITQSGTTSQGLILEPRKRGIMKWISKDHIQQIVIKFAGGTEKLSDSSPIDITKTSYKEFWVPSEEGDFKVQRYFRQVIAKMNDVLYVVLQEINEDEVTIKVENQTHILFGIMQEGVKNSHITAQPKKLTPFAWRNPMDSKNMQIIISKDRNKSRYNDFSTIFEVSKISSLKTCTLGGNGPIKEIKIEIVLEDGVKKVVISQVGKTKRRDNFINRSLASIMQFRMRVPDLGLSLVSFCKNKKRVELLYIQLNELFISYIKLERDQSIQITLKDMVINNNIGHKIEYPIILRKQTTKNPNDPLNNVDILKFTLNWNIYNTKHQYNIKQMKFTINKLQFFLEEEYLEELVDMVNFTFSPVISENLLNERFNWAEFHNNVTQIATKRHFISPNQLENLLYD